MLQAMSTQVAVPADRKEQRFFRVHCFPFRMTDANMSRHAGSRWAQFWRSLKAAYDFFERAGMPPNVVVRNGRYVFETEG